MSRNAKRKKTKGTKKGKKKMSVWSRGDLVRLKDSNKEALIRYVGPVLFRDDALTMYGVELVGEHSRTGEHDGKVKGVRYFISAPAAGTFVTSAQIKCALTSADFRLSDRMEKKLARVLALKDRRPTAVTVEDDEYDLSLPPISSSMDTSDDSSSASRIRSATPGPGGSSSSSSSSVGRRSGRSNSTLPTSARERSKASVTSPTLETVTDETVMTNDLGAPSKPAKRRRKSFSPGMVGDERTVTTQVRSPSSVDRKLGPRDFKTDFTNWSPPDYDLKRDESGRGFLEPRFRRRRDRSKSGITVSSSTPRAKSVGPSSSSSKSKEDDADASVGSSMATLKTRKSKKRRRSASGTVSKTSTRPIPKFKAGDSSVAGSSSSQGRRKGGSVTTKGISDETEFTFISDGLKKTKKEEDDQTTPVDGTGEGTGGFQSPDLTTEPGSDELFGIATQKMGIGMVRARTAPMSPDSPTSPPSSEKKHFSGTDSEGSALISSSRRRRSSHFRNAQSEGVALKSAASDSGEKSERRSSSKSPGRTRRSDSSGMSVTVTGKRRSKTKAKKRLSLTNSKSTTSVPLKRRSLTTVTKSSGSSKRKSGSSKKPTGVAYQSNIAPKRAMERGKRDREMLRKKAAEQQKKREERKKKAAAERKLVFRPKGGSAASDPKSTKRKKKKKPGSEDGSQGGKKGSKKKGKHSKKRSDPSKRGKKKKNEDGTDGETKKKGKKKLKKKKKGGKKKKSEEDSDQVQTDGKPTDGDTQKTESSEGDEKTAESGTIASKAEETTTQSEVSPIDSDHSPPSSDPTGNTEAEVSSSETTGGDTTASEIAAFGGGSVVINAENGKVDASYEEEDYSAEMIDEFDESEAWRFPELRGKDIRFTRIDSMLRGIEKAGDQPAAQLKITIAPVDLVPASTTAVAMAAMAAVAARSSSSSASGGVDDEEYDSESSYETDSSYESSSFMSSSGSYGDEEEDFDQELDAEDSSSSLIRSGHSRSDTMEELRKQLMEMRMETDVLGMAWNTVKEETMAESAKKHGSSSSAKIDEILDEDELDLMSSSGSGLKRSSMFSFGSSDLRNSLFGNDENDDLAARIALAKPDSDSSDDSMDDYVEETKVD